MTWNLELGTVMTVEVADVDDDGHHLSCNLRRKKTSAEYFLTTSLEIIERGTHRTQGKIM